MIRRILELASRGVVFKRRLPDEFGGAPFYVTPDAQLKYWKPGVGGLDYSLIRVARDHIKSDSVVWDIGANVGVFTFASAGIARSGTTVAVEADIWLAQLLRRSRSLPENRNLNIFVVPAAASDSAGVADFLIARRGRAASHLEASQGSTQTGGVRERVSVPTLPLDALLASFPAPDFVKIDVEGAELMVLRGALRILRECRPRIYVEVSSQNSRDAAKLLHDADYDLFDGAVQFESQKPIELCTENTLAVPR
jgi:FkbM family methyltransferase